MCIFLLMFICLFHLILTFTISCSSYTISQVSVIIFFQVEKVSVIAVYRNYYLLITFSAMKCFILVKFVTLDTITRLSWRTDN